MHHNGEQRLTSDNNMKQYCIRTIFLHLNLLASCMRREHCFCLSMIVFFAVPAVVDEGPSAVNVKIGTQVLLKCRSSGDPVPKMRYVCQKACCDS